MLFQVCFMSIFFCCVYPFRIMQPFLFLHEILSFASPSAVPHVSSIFFKSPSKVLLGDIFGLPCFLLPGGFHLKPFLGILFCFILRMCPSHLNLLYLTYVAILQHSVLAYSLIFEILFGQYCKFVLSICCEIHFLFWGDSGKMI